jgi:nitrate/nitrite transporter NarK
MGEALMSIRTSAQTEGSPPPLPPDAIRPPSRLRQILTLSWVVGIVVFTLGRLIVAKGTLEEYGLNLWVFAVIDLVTAVPYALGVAKVVTSMIDRNYAGTTTWATVAAASFLAPYAYIAWAGQDASFPPAVYVALGVLIVIFGGNAVLSVRRKVRAAHVDAVPGGASS